MAAASSSVGLTFVWKGPLNQTTSYVESCAKSVDFFMNNSGFHSVCVMLQNGFSQNRFPFALTNLVGNASGFNAPQKFTGFERMISVSDQQIRSMVIGVNCAVANSEIGRQKIATINLPKQLVGGAFYQLRVFHSSTGFGAELVHDDQVELTTMIVTPKLISLLKTSIATVQAKIGVANNINEAQLVKIVRDTVLDEVYKIDESLLASSMPNLKRRSSEKTVFQRVFVLLKVQGFENIMSKVLTALVRNAPGATIADFAKQFGLLCTKAAAS